MHWFHDFAISNKLEFYPITITTSLGWSFVLFFVIKLDLNSINSLLVFKIQSKKTTKRNQLSMTFPCVHSKKMNKFSINVIHSLKKLRFSNTSATINCKNVFNHTNKFLLKFRYSGKTTKI